MWSGDIFEAETSKLIESGSFETYQELVTWLVTWLTGGPPHLNFWASFQIPDDATEECRSALGTLGTTRSELN